jgi:hypothetical protein
MLSHIQSSALELEGAGLVVLVGLDNLNFHLLVRSKFAAHCAVAAVS